jgi:hypothetical protein
MNFPGKPAGGLPARIGRYEILERIGKGAMGVVYAARDEVMDRVVAVKVMMADLEGEPDTRTRFYREAQAAGRLLHPNIITIFDMGEDESRIYMVMELLKGHTLAEYLRQPAVPLEHKVGLMVQTCEGLAAAHAGGIVHRDIKPGNLFVLSDGSLKILDFGVARLATSTMTASGFIIGTPDYMSPEQARGAEIDPRSDIFSSAAVFYFMLSGRKPFAARDLPTVLRKVQSEPPPPLTEDEAPPVLARLVMRSLSKDPANRHQSMTDFAADLTRFRRHFEAETRQVAVSARERYDAIQNLTREWNDVSSLLGLPAPDEPAAAASLRAQYPAFVERAPELLLVPFTRFEITAVAASLTDEHEALEHAVEPLRRAGTAVETAARALEEGRPEEAGSILEHAAGDLPDTPPVADLRSRCAEAVTALHARRARLDALAVQAREAASAEAWETVLALCDDAAEAGGGAGFETLRLRAREAIDRAARERDRAIERALDRAGRAIGDKRFDAARLEIEAARRLEAPAEEVDRLSAALETDLHMAAAEAALATRAAEVISLARAEFHAGHRDACLSVLRDCLADAPAAPGVARELARLEEEVQRLAAAERRHADAEAHVGLAAAAFAAGDLQAAAREAALALTAEPGHKEAARVNASVQARLRQEAEARDRAQRAHLHAVRAEGLLASGALPKALREAQQALELEPGQPAAVAVAAEVRRRTAEEEAARDRARLISQQLKAARQDLRSGRVNAARQAVGRALEAGPGDEQALELLRQVDAFEQREREKEDATVVARPPAGADDDDTVGIRVQAERAGRFFGSIAARLKNLVRR